MGKQNTDFRVASVLVAHTQTTKQPIYFSYMHFRIKRMFNGTWYNRSLRMLYITRTLLQYLRFCYSFCLTVHPRIINISNVCSTPYRPTVIIRIREICTWSKTMAILTISSCRSATCFNRCLHKRLSYHQPKPSSETMLASLLNVVANARDPQRGCIFKHFYLVFRPSIKKRSKFYRIPMQLNEFRKPALFPSRKCYINLRKIDKNTHPPKGTRSGKQLFFPYPSVFAESYVRCVQTAAQLVPESDVF